MSVVASRRRVLGLGLTLPLVAVLPRPARATFSSAAAYSESFTTEHAVLIWQDGSSVLEAGNVDTIYPVASISKSLTGLVLAKLMDERMFGARNRLHRHLPPEWVQADDRKRSIRLWHAMTMCSGLQPHDKPTERGYNPLALETVAKPAREWAYASAPVDLLGVAMQRRTGLSVESLFNELICEPLEIPPVAWSRPFGEYTRASSGAQMSARNLVKIGQLMLADGKWGGETLIKRSRCRMLRSHRRRLKRMDFTATPGSPFPMSSKEPSYYGHLWWTNITGEALGPEVPTTAYYAHGLLEQLLVIVPEFNLIVVRLGTLPVALPEFRREFMARVMEDIA